MKFRVEGPDDRVLQRGMSTDEAEHFLRTWYRVVEPPDATVAYVPDRATACMIADRASRYRELTQAANLVEEWLDAAEMTSDEFRALQDEDLYALRKRLRAALAELLIE